MYLTMQPDWMIEKQNKHGFLDDPVEQSCQLIPDHLPTSQLLNERDE